MPVIRKRTTPYLSAAFKGRNIPRNPSLSAVSEVDKSLARELMEDDIDVELAKKEIEQLADAHDFLPLTWNEHLLHFLHSLPVEIFIIVLVAIDLCVVLSTMILEVYVGEESIAESQHMSKEFVNYLELLGSTNSCYPIHSSVRASLGDVDTAHAAVSSILAQATANLTSHARRKRSSSTSSTSGTTSGLSPPVEESIGKTLEEVIHGLHYLSIAILSLLVLEALVKIAAHGKHILRNKMEIVDAIVNIASLIIDIMLTDKSTVGAIGKVLVILTLIWRVFRILNAIVITSRARYKFRIRMLKRTKQMLDAKVELFEKNMTRAKHEIVRLSKVATLYGAPQYEVRVFAEFAEEEKTARYGIQESLMQLLRVNDAIVGHPFNRRTKEAEPKEAVTRQSRSSSLPDISTFDAPPLSTTASDSTLERPASGAETECGKTTAAQVAAGHVGYRRSRSGGDSPCDGYDGETVCDAPPPPAPKVHRRSKSWHVAGATAVSNRQVAAQRSWFAHNQPPAKNGGKRSTVGESSRSPDGQDLAVLSGAAAKELEEPDTVPKTVLVVTIMPKLLPTSSTASAADCLADLEASDRQAAFLSGRDRRDRETDSAATVAVDAEVEEFASNQNNHGSSAPPQLPTSFARPPVAESRSDAGEGRPSSLPQRFRAIGESSLRGATGQAVASATDGRTTGNILR